MIDELKRDEEPAKIPEMLPMLPRTTTCNVAARTNGACSRPFASAPNWVRSDARIAVSAKAWANPLAIEARPNPASTTTTVRSSRTESHR